VLPEIFVNAAWLTLPLLSNTRKVLINYSGLDVDVRAPGGKKGSRDQPGQFADCRNDQACLYPCQMALAQGRDGCPDEATEYRHKSYCLDNSGGCSQCLGETLLPASD